MKIDTTSFALHLTYTCPLSCAHCCFESSPQNPYKLDSKKILSTVEALDKKSYKMVAFTGGEPLLLGKTLNKAIEVAKDKGLITRVVTSAYFGSNYKHALKILRNLKASGLDEISISWDDYHEEFVDFLAVKNVFYISRDLGMSVAINCVQDEGSKWSSEKINKELDLDNREKIVHNSPINKTGRAEKKLQDVGLREEKFLGPCPYVITGPTLSAKNKLLACCGVIPETSHLILSDNFKPENLKKDIEKSQSSLLLTWLFLRGSYEILKAISKHSNTAQPPESSIGGNCEACNILFHDKNFTQHLPDVLEKKNNEISSEMILLDALGLLKPEKILSLWQKSSKSIDTAPR